MEIGKDDSISIEINHELQNNNPKTILDLPELCVDKILRYLDLCDLINIADVNDILKISAVRIFHLQFKDKEIKCDKCSNVETFFKTLEHFGPHISRLRVVFFERASPYFRPEHTDEHVLRNVIDKCSSTVTKLTITILNRPDLILNDQFTNLHTLEFRSTFTNRNSNIDDSWTDISRWFPRLRKIKFLNLAGIFNFNESFVKHIPNLENVSFVISEPPEPKDLELMARFLNVNYHIKSLQICMGFEETGTFESTLHWKTLNVSILNIFHTNIPLKHVLELQNLRSLSISPDECFELLRLNQPIEELCILTSSLTDETVNFIRNHPTLRKLSIKSDEGNVLQINHHHAQGMASILKDLTEISFNTNEFFDPGETKIPDGILEFVRHCKYLRSVYVTYQLRYMIKVSDERFKNHVMLYEHLERNMKHLSNNDKWKMTYKCEFCNIKNLHGLSDYFKNELRSKVTSYSFAIIIQN